MVWDVVIIGGGGAALCAGLAAREEGAEVIILSKTALGLGNCTTYSGGAFSLAVGGMESTVHGERTLETGRGLNKREMVEILALESPEAVLGLQQYGIKLDVGYGKVSVAPYAPKKIMAGAAFT